MLGAGLPRRNIQKEKKKMHSADHNCYENEKTLWPGAFFHV